MTRTRPADSAQASAAPLWTAAALAAGLVALIVAGALSGLGTADQISDPGAVTRWGLPVARFTHHLAMAVAVSAALLAAVAVPHGRGDKRRRRRSRTHDADAAEAPDQHPLYLKALQIAGASAVVWTLAALAVLVLSYSALAGQPLSPDEGFTQGLVGFVASIPTGQAWAAMVVISAVFTTLIVAVRAPGGVFVLSLFGLTGIIPMALVGHSASGDDHTAAVNSLALHLLGMIVWVGGLIVLALLSPEIRRQAAAATTAAESRLVGMVLSRYSTIAGLAIAVVAGSGVVNAALRIEAWSQLVTTAYGTLILLKAFATLALGMIGWMHRSWIIPRLTADDPGPGYRRITGLLWQLVLVEAAVMSAVVALSAILGRTSPPVSEDLPPDATPARILTGYDLPPAPELSTYFTLWRPDWLWIALCVFLAAWYLYATVQVRRRGIRWPIMRAVSWLFGLLGLFWVTSGGPAVYGVVLFSGHMIQHMTLTMVIPIFLVMAAPVTLALRFLPVRADASRGAREWILWLVHSRWSKIVTHPLFAAANFAGSILLFYFTPIFGLALRYHIGHELMMVHFLLTGYIFALVLIGDDPLPKRPAYPIRLLMLLATMAFHAFTAIALTNMEVLIEASWFGNMGHDYGFSAVEDQRSGSEMMWGLGEIPAMLMAVIAAIQWSRDDTREMRRTDREAERTGDAELHEYNEMFAQMAERDSRR
ncbi:cytochrome c oxidase assembly protein [Nesterenkonia aerolata]|uniref:Cytochrome c oxidase assembly protein n=1 Tax=Nesterenkonia aerolata TaxID=3074079 RepID=A0ABU2DPC1_9MICC|nr:cytochrome c oxidase assembly protein [Nesterenkonia sp. LY-0111]MDR8018363.1 cytochrome c oxidase assembly protein [Nesterenkonia sp. LY-0111]